jgi:hypothetical protein
MLLLSKRQGILSKKKDSHVLHHRTKCPQNVNQIRLFQKSIELMVAKKMDYFPISTCRSSMKSNYKPYSTLKNNDHPETLEMEIRIGNEKRISVDILYAKIFENYKGDCAKNFQPH